MKKMTIGPIYLLANYTLHMFKGAQNILLETVIEYLATINLIQTITGKFRTIPPRR